MQYRRHQGFAVPVVLLVGAVILVSVVTAASVNALGSRINVSDEKVAYQALLTAESGINTFSQRFSETRYRGSFEHDEENAWLVGLSTELHCTFLTDCSPDSSGEAYLRIVSVQDVSVGMKRITVQSDGKVANGNGQKRVLQDYVVYREPGNPFGNVGAALTSYTQIKVGGNATLSGESGSVADGILYGWDENSDGQADGISQVNEPDGYTLDAGIGQGFSFDLGVDEATLFDVGNYIQIDDYRYKVQGIDVIGGRLTLEYINPTPLTSSLTISDNTPIGLIPYAAAEPVDVSQTTFAVSDTRAFAEEDTVYIKTDPENPEVYAEATIIAVGDGQITVNWTSAPSSTILEGTPITKDADGATSAYDITKNSNSAEITPSQTPYNDDLAHPTGDPSLFEQTFGMTKEEFAASFPLENSWPGVVDGQMTLEGVTYIDSSGAGENIGGNNQALCGSGVLVVEGDLTLNGTCPEEEGGFSGLLYVAGEFRMQGNSVLLGGVVVEGDYTATNIKDDTTVAGTGQDAAKIGYNLDALYQAGNQISAWVFQPIAGTWRQQ